MQRIVGIRVYRTTESCERTSYYVELRTDEGFTKTPDCHVTGSVYTKGVGLSVEEARDRALTDAADWSDLLGIPVDPYEEEGVVHEPSFPLEIYTTQRELAARDADTAPETRP